MVIGSGIGGLGAACLLARRGFSVRVCEKNERLGGLCNRFEAEGFTFDMGPSWYLMPDVFAAFFALLGEKVEDHLDLVKLSPSYRVYFKDEERPERRQVEMYSDLDRDVATVEALEPGAGERLREYLRLSEQQYGIALQSFLYRNSDTIFDFLNLETAREGRRMQVFSPMHRYVQQFFHTEAVQKLMEYQMVFLGSSPYNTPALYNIMAHIDFNMGVYYPRGGIYEIVRALERIGRKWGVTYTTGDPVVGVDVSGGRATGVTLVSGEKIAADIVLSNANIQHTEMALLPKPARSYSPRYWESRVLAPSALILYLGVRGRLPGLVHHSLIFSRDWERNFAEIFDDPKLPTDPSIYICAPSVTDPTVAPPDHENLFVLVPTAPGLQATSKAIEEYSDRTLATLERVMGVPDLRTRICYQRTFTWTDFEARYHNYRGSALGLAHTLRQSAIWRPNNRSRKVRNLFYVGANTNPGIGMPICLISAELAYKRIVGDRSIGHLTQL